MGMGEEVHMRNSFLAKEGTKHFIHPHRHGRDYQEGKLNAARICCNDCKIFDDGIQFSHLTHGHQPSLTPISSSRIGGCTPRDMLKLTCCLSNPRANFQGVYGCLLIIRVPGKFSKYLRR